MGLHGLLSFTSNKVGNSNMRIQELIPRQAPVFMLFINCRSGQITTRDRVALANICRDMYRIAISNV